MNPIRSLTEQVYVKLRADLINCRLRPGGRLRTNELSKRLGVSLSGVREALARLTADGLVVADPQRGFSAAPISADDLAALTEAHIGIEALCLVRSLTVGDARWEAQLIGAFDRIEAIPLADQGLSYLPPEYAAAHAAFEQALVSACDNPWLLRLRSSLSAQTQRYKQICLPAATISPNPTQIAKVVLEAALARDIDRTVALVTESFRINALRFVHALEKAGPDARFLDEVENVSGLPAANFL